MFKVNFGLGKGIDPQEFTFSPALTILKNGVVTVNMLVVVDQREKLDFVDLAGNPSGFANAIFDEHVRNVSPKASMCTNCPRFCLNDVSAHRTDVLYEPMTGDIRVNIGDATIACTQACPPALNKEVAREIRNQLFNRGYGHHQVVDHLEQLVEFHLNDLRNEGNFGTYRDELSYSDMSSSARVSAPRHATGVGSGEIELVLGYLHRALNENLNNFILYQPSEMPPQNKGIPVTQVESVW